MAGLSGRTAAIAGAVVLALGFGGGFLTAKVADAEGPGASGGP